MQTIPVDTGAGQNSQLWDLAVTDLTIDQITQPAVVATGRSPLVVANPQTGELLYNGQITSEPGGDPLTSWGYGVAAGTVAGTPIAVVSATGLTESHVLAVIDLTNPRQPRALATIPLPGSASAVHDVVLRDTNVFIGTTTGTLLVNISNPSQPQFLGTIPSVSGRLAFNGSSILLGTRRGLTETTHSEGGVRTAALEGPLVLIPSIPPQMTRDVEPLPGLGGGEAEQFGPNVEELVDYFDVKILVIGGSPTTGALDLLQNGIPLLRQPLVFTGGRAQARVPQGTRFPKLSRLSLIAAEVDLVPAVSHERVVPAGTVEILLDSNNDSRLGTRGSAADAQDMQAARDGKAFAFWDADSAESDEMALTDFARLIIRRNVTLDSRTRVGVRIQNGNWELKRQVALVKDYKEGALPIECRSGQSGPIIDDDKLQFCWDVAEIRQVSLIKATDPKVSPHAVGGGVIEVPSVTLSEVDNRFLFRCLAGTAGQRGCSAPTIEVGRIRDDGQFVPGPSVKIDIRPLREWMTIKRARTSAVDEVVLDGPLSGSDVTGWVPDSVAKVSGTSQVTILVHGFAVSEAGAATGSFPRLFKRLYWAGHRVFAPQQAHTIGIAWPGGTGANAFFFPLQEMHALRAVGRVTRERRHGVESSRQTQAGFESGTISIQSIRRSG